MDSFITVADNSQDHVLDSHAREVLFRYAGITLQELCKAAPDLLIFPHSLGENEDGIATQKLFEITGGKLKTGNLMGFFCVDDVQVSIHSRFDKSEKQYFLHYMLQNVLGINILNFKNGIGQEKLWEFLVYLFPYCLIRALRQGLLRAYRQYECNDSRIKGAVDVARHLKFNFPFNGKIAYRVREYSADNSVMQLIRHTIEFIKNHSYCSGILNNNGEIKNAVSQIVDLTPSYRAQDRTKIIFQNLRNTTHPYFTEYTFLCDLCLKILRHDKISTGNDEKHIRGIVFDGAWLWEEYLATMLTGMGYEHPENKTGKGVRYLFKNEKTGKIFPDFIGKEAVLDAKYKRLGSGASREDRFQIISYLHVLEDSLKKIGCLLYPSVKNNAGPVFNELKGYKGTVGVLFFYVPQNCAHFSGFSEEMKKSEEKFCEVIRNIETLVTENYAGR